MKCTPFNDALKQILEIKIAIVYVIAILIIYWITKIFFKKEINYYTKKQEKLRDFNKTIDQSSKILYKWVVYFDDETPFIADLTAFCTKHGEMPIRFMDDSCPIRDCENSRQQINKYAVKNLIESDLINRWEKINISR